MGRLHGRMPAVIEPEQAGAWLDPRTSKEAAAALLAPAADGILAMHPVGTRVNSPRNNSAGLVEPVKVEPMTAEPARANGERAGLFGAG